MEKVKKKLIYKVELYYSSFNESNTFSQRRLNMKRLQVLRDEWPELFDNNVIEWKLIEQVENKNKDKAQRLFHGFLFYSKEPYVESSDGELIPLTAKEEIAIIKSKLGIPLETDEETDLPLEVVCDSMYTVIDTTFKIKKKKVYSGLYWPKNKRKKAEGKLYEKKGIWNRRRHYDRVADTIFKIRVKEKCGSLTYKTSFLEMDVDWDELTRFSWKTDTVIRKAFNENTWDNAIVVQDVTGSMSPYLLQTLEWRRWKTGSTNLKHFSFYNDGDDQPDGPIGKSFGVYHIHSDNINEIDSVAFYAMRQGSGGGVPENDIEAMIRALDSHEMEVTDLILVVDNNAPIRDRKLISKLKERNFKLTVVVCGAYQGRVLYHYVDLVRQLGGHIITIEEDIYLDAKKLEGTTFNVGDQTYEVKKGKLTLVKSKKK
jgi:hypothetical protein